MNIPLRAYWTLLVSYLKPHGPKAALLGVLVLSSIALQLANPQIMRRFMDTALSGGAPDVLLRVALAFLAVALVQQGVGVLATYVGENVGWSATNALRADLAEHCLRLDLSFHNAHTPGEMIERLDGDVTALANFFSQFVVQVLGNALLLLGVLVLLAREDWRVGGVLAAFASLALVILGRVRGLAVPHWAAERQASADLFGYLEERLAGTEDIRACGAVGYVLRSFYRLMREWLHKTLRAGLLTSITTNATATLVFVAPTVAMAVGAYLYQRGELTIGGVYLAFFYASMLTTPISQITLQMQDLQRAGASVSRVRDLLATQSRIPQRSTAADLPPGALAVHFEAVSFGYRQGLTAAGTPAEGEAKDLVLCDITFRLAPGQVLGLLGRTGSGKTTLTRLLLRFYDPDQGTIRLGPHLDPRDLPLAALRRRVGLVTQEIQLFHATVRDNLTFFDSSAADERIVQVLRELGLGRWYDSLPLGLDTTLESEGGGLSAGEAQLLAFARVFLQEPGLVILDEASSRLDPATEQLIERAVDRLLSGRTAIVIAHRLGTVQRADEIMILEEGRIAEYGPREVLAADSHSRFCRLLRTGLEEVLV